MKARWSLLRSKFDRFDRHHKRLNAAPDPKHAEERFHRVLRACRRIERTRLGFYALIYIGTLGAIVLTILSVTRYLDFVGAVIRFLVSSAPLLAVVGLVGVLLCTRALGQLEVDLFYFSEESRMDRPKNN